MFTIEFYILSALLAAFAWVFYWKLTDDGKILSVPFRWLMEWRHTPEIVKQIFDCFSCLSGQCALWFYPVWYWHSYNVFDHIIFITTTIFLVNLFNKWQNSNE